MVRSKAAAAKRKRLEEDGGGAAPADAKLPRGAAASARPRGAASVARPPRDPNEPKEDDGQDPKRAYCSRLPAAWKDDDLRKACEPFGAVARASVVADTAGASRGFGFVVFEDEAGKAAAVAAGAVTKLRGAFKLQCRACS